MNVIDDYGIHLNDVIKTLERSKTEIINLATYLIMEGELKQPGITDTAYGYPYNYDLYIKDSLDPNVQVLAELINKIENSINTIKENNIGIDFNKCNEENKEVDKEISNTDLGESDLSNDLVY